MFSCLWHFYYNISIHPCSGGTNQADAPIFLPMLGCPSLCCCFRDCLWGTCCISQTLYLKKFEKTVCQQSTFLTTNIAFMQTPNQPSTHFLFLFLSCRNSRSNEEADTKKEPNVFVSCTQSKSEIFYVSCCCLFSLSSTQFLGILSFAMAPKHLWEN